MTGRELFEKYNKIIELLFFLIKPVPKAILNFIWGKTDAFENKFVILYRYLYLKKYCKGVGKNIFIGKFVTLKNIDNMTLCSNISIHAYTYIDAIGGLTIMKDVSIAAQSAIYTFNHSYTLADKPIKYNPIIKGQVTICEDVWIGTGVKILSGVTIGNRSIVAAGAVVNKDIVPNCIAGGVPAKLIKNI